MEERKVVTVFADGACIPNPGPGGWAFRLQFKENAAQMFGSEQLSTNLRMEIEALRQGLRHLKEPCNVLLVSDSAYLCDGISRWLSKWKTNGWKNANGDPIKHVDLWLEIDALINVHHVVAGPPTTPAEIKANATVDDLANEAAKRQINSALSYLK